MKQERPKVQPGINDSGVLSKEILKVLAIVAVLAAVWHLRFVFIVVLSAFMLTVILMPFVRVLAKAHLPALLAILLPLGIFTTVLVAIITYAAPTIRNEFQEFIVDLPVYVDQLPMAEQLNITAESVRDIVLRRLGDANNLLFDVGSTVVKVTFGVLTLLVLSMYWMSSYDRNKPTLISYLPLHWRAQAYDIWDRIEHKLGKWFLGQVIVSTTVGLMVWFAATLLGLPFAGTLATIAFLLEIVPTVGPVASSIPAMLVGLSESPEKAVLVAIAYVIIQQIESQLVTPVLMGKTVRLHPAIIIVAFMTGAILFGVLGALLSVPTALIISSFVDSFRQDHLPEDGDIIKLPANTKSV